MKEFTYNVNVVEAGVLDAKNEEKAIERIKEVWKQDHNIDLEDDEITIG